MRTRSQAPLAILSLLAVSAVSWGAAAGAVTIKSAKAKMGSQFEITVVADDEAAAWRAIESAWSEIDRIESLISSWQADSETSLVNRSAGEASVEVSQELFDLTRRALRIARLTGGAFDPTFGGLSDLWHFDGSQTRVPSADAIRAALERVGWHRVEADADARTLFLPRAGMRLGFGAIGKGYAANRAVFVLKDAGIRSGVVNAGGDLVAFGTRENGEPWTVGIQDPRQPETLLGRLVLSETAVVTSGDYERFVEIEGERYAHILDPRTGWPVRGMQSVTVVCPDGELADALATATFVLGPQQGLELVDRLRGVEAMLVDAEGRIHMSSGFKERMETSDIYQGSDE